MYITKTWTSTLSICRIALYHDCTIMGKFKRQTKSAGPKQPPLTHFLCLPLVTKDSRRIIEASLQQFQSEVANPATIQQPGASSPDDTNEGKEDEIVSRVHPKAIRPAGTLHLTLGVMSLDERQLTEAVDFLQALDVKALLDKASLPSSHPPGKAPEKAIEMDSQSSPSGTPLASGPLKLQLKGLESMHDPQRTSILYSAPSDATSRLYPFCLALQEAFKEKDFLVKDDRKLKLHATIVNTIYAKGRKRPAKPQINDQVSNIPKRTKDLDSSQGHGPLANSPLKIDATSLIEKYTDFVWAENIILDRVAVCEMGAKKILNEHGEIIDEKYTEVATIPLPA